MIKTTYKPNNQIDKLTYTFYVIYNSFSIHLSIDIDDAILKRRIRENVRKISHFIAISS